MAIAFRERIASSPSIQFGSRWREFDWLLLLATGALVSFGVFSIWSAVGGGPLVFANLGVRQGAYAALGFIGMFVISMINYRYFSSFAWLFYFGTVGVLGLVLLRGEVIAGSQRWFVFGPLSIQPSEFGKLAMIIVLAAFVASRGEAMQDLGNVLLALLLFIPPMALIFRQPDLGTTIVYGAIWFAIMFFSPTPRRYLVALLLLAIPAFYLAWELNIFHEYQKTRLLVSYDPGLDPLGEGYNILQARISIGSGGWTGAGIQGGSQSQLGLLGVRESDFIFAHASGMTGFLGMCALLLCYILVLWRCFRVIEGAKDPFGQLMAVGIGAMIAFQAVVNIGMNVGLLPVTGITLPFVSAGSSALWTFLFAEGILQAILMRRRRFAFQAE